MGILSTTFHGFTPFLEEIFRIDEQENPNIASILSKLGLKNVNRI